jgi:hypothetical protein
MIQKESLKIFDSKGRMVSLPEITKVEGSYPVELKINPATEKLADTYNLYVIYAISNSLQGSERDFMSKTIEIVV